MIICLPRFTAVQDFLLSLSVFCRTSSVKASRKTQIELHIK